ncbi:uncharacterized protein LOC141607565 [Silene latifolia]|uniref:uncharacterized protein LOC141607565 n=1 Tax=Silene latifolia TaxID=37657 RepID=UPI003D7743D8
METLKPSTRFAISPLFSSQNITHTSCFIQTPSTLTAIRSFRCSASRPIAENSVAVADRLNNPASPWLMLPSEVDENTGQKLDCFYSLADDKILRLNRKKSLKVPDTAKCIASTMGWLGFVDTKDCSVYLSNPFLNDVVQLPSLETLPSVLAVQRDPKTNNILKFKEDYFPGMPYNQVVYDEFRNLFYTLFDNSGIQAYDLVRDRGRRSKMVFHITKEMLESELKQAFEKQGYEALKALGKRWNRKYYLVTLQNGELLLIVRQYEIPKAYTYSHTSCEPHKTLQFDVFRVVNPGFLERVTCLDNDRAIFIGWNQSFCIKASSSPGVSPNCIYFTDDISNCEDYNVHPNNQWGHDTGIYRMEDATISSCYPYLDKEKEMKAPIPTPLFWVAPLSSCVWYMAREHGIDDEKLSVIA